MTSEKQHSLMLVIGTRPEAIKLIPLYFACKRSGVPVRICCTMQHGELLEQVFALFRVTPDYNLSIMRPGQDLFYMTQALLQKTKELFIREEPSLVVVQGDTTSAMVAALSAFYLQIPVAHVEAGLRSDDLYAPFPEEMNRRVIGSIAQHHFAPTQEAVDNLHKAGVAQDKIYLVGNTVVDALRSIQERVSRKQISVTPTLEHVVQRVQRQGKKLIVLTIHRRESFAGGIETVLAAMRDYITAREDLFCVYPFHPNPRVLAALQQAGLRDEQQFFLSEPLVYSDMVHLIHNADLVVTDSGGIQEEAVSLAKPVIVLREKTERMEGVYAGIATLVGFDEKKLCTALDNHINAQDVSWDTRAVQSLYGDGFAAEKIVSNLQEQLTRVQYQQEELGQNKKEIFEKKMNKDMAQKKDNSVKNVSVVGLGYIGLPSALILSEHGYSVVGVDVDTDRVHKIMAGDPVIYEPEVYEKLQIALQSGFFVAQTEGSVADYIVIAVPTPCVTGSDKHKKADLTAVFAAADSVASYIKKGTVVVLESTVPVGTTDKLAQTLAEKTGMRVGHDFFVAHCPERVLPGKIFQELVENDRIIGGVTPECADKARELYATFVRGKLYITQAKAAEMVKLVENSSRDVQIAFANQVGSMAQAAGLDPYEIIDLANKHPRVSILKPSCGVGGHCIAIDPWFLIETFPEQTHLLQAARKVNDTRPEQVLSAVRVAVDDFKKNQAGRCTVAALGLAYKADIDDLRESPALAIATALQQDTSIDLVACEPHVKQETLQTVFTNSTGSVTEAIQQADIVLFLVPHTRFNVIEKKQLQGKRVLDVCGLFYKPRKNSGSREPLFWPARSMMDFFIVNQEDTTSAVLEHDGQEDLS